jgi:hypothetical protein
MPQEDSDILLSLMFWGCVDKENMLLEVVVVEETQWESVPSMSLPVMWRSVSPSKGQTPLDFLAPCPLTLPELPRHLSFLSKASCGFHMEASGSWSLHPKEKAAKESGGGSKGKRKQIMGVIARTWVTHLEQKPPRWAG